MSDSSFSNGQFETLQVFNGVATGSSLLVELLYFYITSKHPYLYSNPKIKMIHYLIVANTITTVFSIPPYFLSESNSILCDLCSFLRHFGNLSGAFFIAAIARSSYLQLAVSRSSMGEIYDNLIVICFLVPMILALM